MAITGGYQKLLTMAAASLTECFALSSYEPQDYNERFNGSIKGSSYSVTLEVLERHDAPADGSEGAKNRWTQANFSIQLFGIHDLPKSSKDLALEIMRELNQKAELTMGHLGFMVERAKEPTASEVSIRFRGNVRPQ